MAVAPEIEAPALGVLPPSPYVGLVPFDEGDAAFFFGRSTEIAIVAANLRASRLTILYGPSGVGKSSLLMAGVVHRLRQDADEADEETTFAVCAYRSWRDDPLQGVRDTVRTALAKAAGDEALPPAATFAQTLRAWTGRTGTLLLVLDQFEEYFQYHAEESDEQRLTGFAAELARIVNDPALPVHVLLSIREDAWAKLDRFKGRIPALFSNYLRVDHLDLEAAREAIEGPIDAWNRARPGDEPYAIEPALTAAVLEAAAGGELALGAGGDRPAVEQAPAPGDRVEAPFLQLVMERLWRATLADGSHTLTVARLEALGGARRIVENHLLDALARLTPQQQDIASDCFRFLVSSGKTKIAHPAADLAEWTQRPEPDVTAVLDMLCSGESGRILRAVAPAHGETSTSYELFHDVLAEPILAWRHTHEAERARRAFRRRVLRVGGILVGLLAVFAALGIWALLQRSDARHATKSATSVALASAANDQLDTRVDESLLLGLAAYKAGRTVQAKSAMLSALETARRSAGNISLVGHNGAVRGVAFSPDGATVASAGADNTVRLWNVSTHTEIGQPLRGHTDSVLGVAFSPDGRMLVSGGDDQTVRLWDIGTRRAVGRPMRANTSVLAVAFSPDGRLVASAGHDGTVRLWDVSAKREVAQLRGHSGSVESVAFSPNGRTLASASDDGTLLLWDVRTRRRLGAPFTGNTSSVWGVAFSPNGRLLASAGYDKTIRLFSVRTHREIGPPLRGHRSPVDGVAFSPDGARLASASNDKTVRFWSVRTHRPIGRPFRGHTGIVYAVAFSPDGKTLASASDDATVRLWDLRPRVRLGAPLRGHTKSVQAVAFSPDGKVLASAGNDTAIRLWNVQTREPIGKPLLGHTKAVYGLAFTPSGSMLASASWDGTVRLWNVRTRKEIGRPLDDRSGAISGVAFSPDGTMLAVAGYERVRLWDVSTHKPIGKPLLGDTDSVSGVAFSPDGNTLVSSSWDGTVRLWNVHTGKQIGEPLDDHSGVVYGVAFSPDGSMVATADQDTAVRLWDVHTHKRIGQPLKGHTDEAQSVVFSPDGTMLASGSVDQTVRLWDVKTHRELGQPLTGHTSSVYAVAFSPDGTRLASAGFDDTVRLWDGILWRNVADLQNKVCKLVVANITKVEWEVLAPGIAYRKACPRLR